MADTPSRSQTPPPIPGRAPRQSSGLATASLTLGIMGVLCGGPIFGIPAVICGHIALSRINRSRGQIEGQGRATAGLVTGYVAFVGIAFWAILAGMTLPALSQAREKARRINCAANLKQIGLGMRMYSADNREYFPVAFSALMRQGYLTTDKVFVCPATQDEPVNADNVDNETSYRYFGRGVTEAGEGQSPATTIVASDRTGNHRRFVNVLFADGHVQGVVLSEGQTLESAAEARGYHLPRAANAP